MHRNTTAAVSDGKTVMKFILFNDLAKEVEEGRSYLIRNYGLSKYGTQQTLLTQKQTALYATAEVHVPQHLESEAKNLLTVPSHLTKLKTYREWWLAHL